ncbi:MAG: hypothetical protein LBN37_08480 [Bacteroidales bacterium]|jgi:hypothetical protein|nr:hypothetical protein [Bacteroidales bacterium]
MTSLHQCQMYAEGGKFGCDLLSHKRSTINADRFKFPVRNGKFGYGVWRNF